MSKLSNYFLLVLLSKIQEMTVQHLKQLTLFKHISQQLNKYNISLKIFVLKLTILINTNKIYINNLVK